jgi:hypothetical protein
MDHQHVSNLKENRKPSGVPWFDLVPKLNDKETQVTNHSWPWKQIKTSFFLGWLSSENTIGGTTRNHLKEPSQRN